MDECNKFSVCVITGSRAEYGLLRQLLFKMKANTKIELKLVVSGSHLSDNFGNTQNEIKEDGFGDYISIPIPVECNSRSDMAISTGTAVIGFSKLFSEYRPDLVVVLGDRFEIFAASIAACIIGIPIAHISGGDLTQGAIDDVFRHCITKMSRIHFPGCEQSAKRIVQMGESAEYVFDVGEPGVENCVNTKLYTKQMLAKELQFQGVLKKYAVVTFHPVTQERDLAIEQLYELMRAMDTMSELFYVITLSNSDAGGVAFNEIWREETKKHPNWLLVSSLGSVKYLSAMKYAKFVVGNSSSGIVEAPSLGVPTVNIGDRQKGRMIAQSVICCQPLCDEIVPAMEKAIDEEFQIIAQNTKSPFGDGTTSEKIMKVIVDYLENGKLKRPKEFCDISFIK